MGGKKSWRDSRCILKRQDGSRDTGLRRGASLKQLEKNAGSAVIDMSRKGGAAAELVAVAGVGGWYVV